MTARPGQRCDQPSGCRISARSVSITYVTGLNRAATSIGVVRRLRGTKFGVRNISGKKIRPPELVAAALRVFSAISWMKPTNTTDHNAVNSTTSRNPTGPLATRMPNTNESSISAVARTRPLTSSASSRPSTIEVRGIGVARSLSK